MHCSNCLPSSGGSPERQPTAIRRYGSHAFKQSPNGSLQTADATRVTYVRVHIPRAHAPRCDASYGGSGSEIGGRGRGRQQRASPAMMTAMRLVSKARAAHTCARHKHIVSAHDATGLHTRTGAEAERVPTGKPSTARRSRRSTRPGDVHLRVRQHA